MKIAIFHDYMETMGGAEKTVLTLAKGLDADIYTCNFNKNMLSGSDFVDVRVHSLGSLLGFPILKQVHASIKFSLIDFSKDYDFFIFSGNWAQYAGKKHHPNIYYCYTPTRAFFDQYDNVSARQGFLGKLVFSCWVKIHRFFEIRSLRHVERIIGISKNTCDRIRKFYKREAELVYPPTDVDSFQPGNFGDFWISVNRLYPEKRVEAQIEVFKKLGIKLKIVGGYGKGDRSGKYVSSLKKMTTEKITFLGDVDDDKIKKLYSTCRGLICTAIDEDYGITPIEAMACGKPVVAVNEGGFRETVIDGVTGRLVDFNIDKLVEAVRDVNEKPGDYSSNCIKQAEKFDSKKFIDGIKRVIQEL